MIGLIVELIDIKKILRRYICLGKEWFFVVELVNLMINIGI